MTLAEQALVQVRIDKDLRDEVAGIYAQLGMDLPTAIRMFLKRSVIERGLPFETTLPEKTITRNEAIRAFGELRAQSAHLPEISLAEINEEIAAVRSESGDICRNTQRNA